MGNQECSVKSAQECVKRSQSEIQSQLPWAPQTGPPQLRYQTAEGGFENRGSGSPDGRPDFVPLSRGFADAPTASRSSAGGGGGSRNVLSVEEVGPGGGALTQEQHHRFASPSQAPAPHAAVEAANEIDFTLTRGRTTGIRLAAARPELSPRLSHHSSGGRSAPSSPSGAPSGVPDAPGPPSEPFVNSRLPKSYFDGEIGEGPGADHDDQEYLRHKFRSGAVYEGDWLKGMRHGVGRQVWPDGTEYIGEWYRGRAGGRGRITHRDGDVYTGQWVNGRAHGWGIYEFGGGSATYHGEFRIDQRDGYGVERWEDGSCYQGQFRRGEKTGYGENVWPDGTSYIGSWNRNALSGPGHFEVHGGQTYKGQWENSTPNGFGVYEWPDGRVYKGGYLRDKKHGFGILTEPEKEPLQCFWVKGEPVKGDPVM